MQHSHSKRKQFKSKILSIAIACATGLTASIALSGNVMAEQKTLYVGMNGGDMERTFTQHVFPVFEKAHNAKVVVVPGTSVDILAKAQAYRDNPQMHVILLDDGVMLRAASMGLCEKLNDDPVLNDIYPNARLADDHAVGITLGMTGLGYNTKLFEQEGWAPPTSWMDLADPKYKGKIVFQSASSSSFGLHGFLLFNRIMGGDETNVEPGFTNWEDTIGKNVLEYISSSAKVAEMIQTNEAAMFPMNITAIGRLQRRDIAVDYAHPKEGAALLMVTQCILADNSEPELAQKLALFLLSAEAQSLALEHGSEVPSNITVEPSEQTREHVERVRGYLEDIVVVDWDTINQNRQAWNARWNRTIER